MSERFNLDPKDLIEQKGPNQGNIKDVELARIGAEAEESARQMGRDSFMGGQEGEDLEIVPDEMGKIAMIDKLRQRVLGLGNEMGISPAGIEVAEEEAAESFIKNQRLMTSDRIDEESIKLTKLSDASDLLEQSGPNKGNIGNVDLAMSGAEAEESSRNGKSEGIYGPQEMGEFAMVGEIKKMVKDRGQAEGISSVGAEDAAEKVAADFLTEQNGLTEDRVEEEVRRMLGEAKPE